MSVKLSQNDYLKILKNAITSLKPTGSNGFEGLLAKCLNDLTGKIFRLAGSGSQHGIDGASYDNSIHLTFEGKLYTGRIRPNDIKNKVFDIVESGIPPNLWMLCATTEIKEQLEKSVRNVCDKNSIHHLILDWPSSTNTPPLATLCAMSRTVVLNFFKSNTQDESIDFKKVETALQKIESDKQYLSEKEKILSLLNEPTLGLPLAYDKNKEWLNSVVSNESESRLEFGQNLAVKQSNNLMRLTLMDSLIKGFSICNDLTKPLAEKIDDDKKEIVNDIITILGNEGSGKSWLFVNSWIKFNSESTLLLMFSANNFSDFNNSKNVKKLIVRQLIKQTMDEDSEFKEKRWDNVLNNWKNKNKLDNSNNTVPNIIVYIDGLNEYPNHQWVIWIEVINRFLSKINGILAISCRKEFFETNILPKNRKLKKSEIIVPEWTIPELEEILETKHIKIDKLNQKVINALRNPRLLAIALDLFSNQKIQSLNDMSPSRLLFEHLLAHLIRHSQINTADELKFHLSEVAKGIINRKKTNDKADLSFNTLSKDDNPLTKSLTNILEGRYIEFLPDDITRYRLKDDGLILALALLIISNMKESIRNNLDISNSLTAIIEPISSLDIAADVVIAAIEISSIDDNTPNAITIELIHEFLLKIQNLKENMYEVFVSITRNRTKLLMDVLFKISISDLYYRNSNLLVSALCDVRKDNSCWKIMKKEINNWLSYYSLKPSMRMARTMSQNKSKKDIGKIRETEKQKLENKINSMSEFESNFKNKFMQQNDKLDTTKLVRNSFQLLSGMPLTAHVEYLVAWKFGQSINPIMFSIDDEFKHLIQFNNCDWKETRSKFLDVTSFLNETSTSSSGKWALASILWALATEKDSLYAHKITKELTKDRKDFKGFSLKEKYCDSDPCEPNSIQPNNLKPTIEKYNNLLNKTLFQSFNISSEDRYFRDVNAAMARFKPKLAIKKYRVIFKNLLNLQGRNLYSLCHHLQQCNSLILDDLNKKLIEKAQMLSKELNLQDENTNEEQASLQYLIKLILPNLNGTKQLEFLISLDTQGSGGPLLSQFNLYKVANKNILERSFQNVVNVQIENKIITLLMFARYSNTEITEKTKLIIEKLIYHKNKSITREVMNLASKYPLMFKNIIKVVVENNWNANRLDPRNDSREIYFGSRILILAEKYGYISVNKIFKRLPLNGMGFIASRLTKNQTVRLASLIGNTINKLISNNKLYQLNEIDNDMSQNRPPLLEVGKALDSKTSLEMLGQKENQDKINFSWNKFNNYLEGLSNNESYLVLDSLDRKTINICIDNAPDLVRSWVNSILNKEPNHLHHIRNIGFCIAECLSKKEINQSVRLFKHLALGSSTITQIFGIAKIPQSSWSIWNSNDNDKLNKFRMNYLSLITNDQELFIEILTANIHEKNKLIEGFVNKLICSNKPINIARAITVCGLGVDSSLSTKIITKFNNAKGLIGNATKAAIFAYERNQWAEHWYKKMDRAQTKAEFWKFSVLFLKVVDARFEVWKIKFIPQTKFMSEYWPNLLDAYKNRIKKLTTQREKKLFGQEKPEDYFL